MRSFEELLNKKMSRKEFLTYSVVLFFSFLGIYRLLDVFLIGNKQPYNGSKVGFGSGPYGGTRKETI